MNSGVIDSYQLEFSNLYLKYKKRVEESGGILSLDEHYFKNYYSIISRSIWTFIPGGYTAGKLYTIYPNNSESDVSFIRNSNATSYSEYGKLIQIMPNTPIMDWNIISGKFNGLRITRQSTNVIANSINSSYVRKANVTEINHEWTFTNIYNNGVYFENNNQDRYAGKFHIVDNAGLVILSAFVEMDDGSEPQLGHYSDSSVDFSINIGGGNIFLRHDHKVFKEQISPTVWRIAGKVHYSGYSANQFIKKSIMNSDKGFKVTGFMIETGKLFPGNHIPTTGTAATKLFDEVHCFKSIRMKELIIYADVINNYPHTDPTHFNKIISLELDELNLLCVGINEFGNLSMAIVRNGITLLQIDSQQTSGKLCAKFCENNYSLIANGIENTTCTIGTQNTAGLEIISTKIKLGNESCDIYIKATAILNNLSSSELVSLTI